MFNKIGIIFNKDIKTSQNIALNLKEKIENADIFSLDELKNDIDLAIAIGGDGTFLKASRFYSNFSIPILGLNIGRLGFLAQIQPTQIENMIEQLKSNDYIIDSRLMLESSGNTALNDIVIKGTTCLRTSTLDLYINNEKLCSYVADGLIVATPTGSTAYSLSAGGPIIYPNLDCFLITPICPHTLNSRPILIPSTEKITIKSNEEKKELSVAFDGQIDINVKKEVTIQKSPKKAKLLILGQKKDKFYGILKEKLHWSLENKK